jgi:hypothetical protein
MRRKSGELFIKAMEFLRQYRKVTFPVLLALLALSATLFTVQSYRVFALKRGLCFLQPSCKACSEK